jgi:cytidylate kinase
MTVPHDIEPRSAAVRDHGLPCDPSQGTAEKNHPNRPIVVLSRAVEKEMPLVTITHSFGSSGPAIAREVAQNLAVELFDDDKLQHVALDMGVHKYELGGLAEKVPGMLDRLLTSKPQLYLDLLESVIYQVARRGEGVIIGHGSQLLLRDFGCALHVRIQADRQRRVESIVEQQGISRSAADRQVRKADDAQRGFMRYAFQMDPDDLSLYDLVVNSEKFGVSTAAALITAAARSDDVGACSLMALDAMKRLSLEKQVHAALIKDGADPFEVDVFVPVTGTVVLTGLVRSQEEEKRLVEIAGNLPDVTDVQSELLVKTAGV